MGPKRIVFILCAASCGIFMTAIAFAQENFIRGDANSDGTVNAADTTAMRGYLYRGEPALCEDAIDVNDDGRIDVMDEMALAMFLFFGGSAPRAPYPDCGQDPTADALDCETGGCGGSGECMVTMTGDVDLTEQITSADVIGMVNYVFKGGLEPQPCVAAGDINCSGDVTSADIIWLVAYVFKGQEPPCDICTMIPDPWSCP